MNKKKVAILTTFHQWTEAYSLTGVVKHQLLALVKHGYKPTLFVLESFPEEHEDRIPEGVEVKKVIPQITTEPYQGVAASRNVPQQFEKDVAKIIPAFQEHFKYIDILLTNDIIFQDSFMAYNAALRKVQLPKELKMFHWMHSGPSKRPAKLEPPVEFLYSLPPQSTLIYMNNYDKTRAAEMYGLYQNEVRVVHNPIDYRTLPHIHPIVGQIITHFDLNKKDVVAVYPLSTTRMGSGGKQLHKALWIMSHLKKLDLEVLMIVPNAHANGDNEKAAIDEMLKFARNELGLDPEKDIVFTSLINPPENEHGIDHNAVLQLFQISDVFLFPSVSENAPLILLEAALAKNLLVLNEDFSPMKDFVGPNALYFKFDSVTTTTNHPAGEDNYYKDVAKIIWAELANNLIYKSHRIIRKHYNIDWMFEHELEPLFYEDKEEAPARPVDKEKVVPLKIMGSTGEEADIPKNLSEEDKADIAMKVAELLGQKK